MIDFNVCLFLQYVFLLLIKSFCIFVGKNIDWRLPNFTKTLLIILWGYLVLNAERYIQLTCLEDKSPSYAYTIQMRIEYSKISGS